MLPSLPTAGIKGTWPRLQGAPGHRGLRVGPGRMGPDRHCFRRDVDIIFDSGSSETISWNLRGARCLSHRCT